MQQAASGGGGDSEAGVVLVYVTAPDRPVADRLAQGLVEGQLAACVTLVPGVESVYRWEGKVTRDAELLLLIKSRAALLPALTAWVRDAHPYDECEVIAAPVVGGSASYLQWVVDSTKG